MGRVETLRQPIRSNLQHREQIQSQEEQIHQIFVADILSREMGVNQTQPLQTSPGTAHCTQSGDHDPLEITDHDLLHLTGS